MKGFIVKSSSIASAAVLLSTVSLVVMAGDGFAQEEASSLRGVFLEEITVTARKREESLQTVPVAVSAIAGRALERGYLQDLSDMAGVAPNVVIDPTIGFSNAASISIRGVSFQDIEKSFDPAVGVVVDGVYLATNSQALLDNFDLERIEILRGPQGTLFGKNTTGGLVNVIRKRPAKDLSAYASYSYGRFDHHQIKASIDAPVSDDRLAFRFAGNWDRSDGYMLNTVNGEKLSGTDIFQGRAAALFTPTPEWEFYLNYDYIRDRGDTVGLRNATMPTQLFAVPGLLGLNPLFPGFPADDGPLREVRSDFPNIADYTTHAASLEINWRKTDFTVTSVTGYRTVDEEAYHDFDAENTANFNSTRIQDHEQFTQELRLTSAWSDTYEFVAGVYYYWSKYDLVQQIDVLTDWLPCGVLPGPFASLGCTQTGNAGQTAKSVAGFLQGNVNITPKLRLTAGGRYTYEKKDFFSTPITFPIGALGSATAKENWSEFTPRISLDYQATDDLFLFASYATGFKSGGFNGRAGTTTSIGPYDPETVDTFEAGLKSEWADKRLRFNVTGFHNKYKNMQVEVLRVAAGGTGQETVVENAASATTYGLEVEFEAVPAEGLTLSGNLGLLDAEYDEFIADLGTGLGVIDNSDLKLRRAPSTVFGVAANYVHPVGNAGQASLSLRYNWQDDLHTTTQNLELGHRRSVGILNGSIGFESSDSRWSVNVYGQNLTNEIYVTDGIAIGNLVSLQTISKPRELGIRFDVRL